MARKKTLDELKAERNILAGELQSELAGRTPAEEQPDETLRQAASPYLDAVRAMPTCTERVRDIALWVEEFGDRKRSAISPADIRAVRDRWLREGPCMVPAKSEAETEPGKRRPVGWKAVPWPARRKARRRTLSAHHPTLFRHPGPRWLAGNFTANLRVLLLGLLGVQRDPSRTR